MAVKVLGLHLLAEPLESVTERAARSSNERVRRVAMKELARRRPDRRIATVLGELLQHEPEGPLRHMAARVFATHAHPV